MEHYATAQQVYAAGVIFARLGGIVMLMPGVGESLVPANIRLAFALVFTLVLFPVLGAGVPPIPGSTGGLAGALIKELLIGLMMGAVLRMFLASLATAGEIISIETTLSFAQTTNPTEAIPTQSLSTFLSTMGVLLVMTTDLHHLFIGAIVKSYAIFPFHRAAPVADAAQLAVQTFGQAFALGVQLAAPVLVFSLVFNIATGLVARVMPQFQVFFAATPLQLLLGLSLFALSLGMMGMVWLAKYRDLLAPFGG